MRWALIALLTAMLMGAVGLQGGDPVAAEALYDRASNLGGQDFMHPAYLDAARELARGGFRCVVFGHTHLPKHVQLDNGALYINTGTWADVMRFPMEILTGSDEQGLAKLREFVDDIAGGKLNRWIGFGATYARLDMDAADRLIQAELLDFERREEI